MASETPQEYAEGPAAQFLKLGAARADWLIFERGKADSPGNLARMKTATGVFFSGGDQVRLCSFMDGTRLLEEVRRLYREGGAVGGTSAGAAVMSKVMLTGDDRMEKDGESFTAIRSSSVVVAEGFGFLPPYIVADQHFLVRKRENRLISVVLENPSLTGIGIDEATALVVRPGGAAEVVGDSLVSVYDVSGAGPVTTDEKGHLAARGITLSLLKAGDKLDLLKLRPAARAAK
jgi:cyanophycinase